MVDLYTLIGDTLGHLVPGEHDPLAVIGYRQLRADMAQHPVAENVAQPVGGDVQLAMQVRGTGGTTAKRALKSSTKFRKEIVAAAHRADSGQAQLLDQTVLHRPVHPLDTALRLTGIRTDDLNVQF